MILPVAIYFSALSVYELLMGFVKRSVFKRLDVGTADKERISMNQKNQLGKQLKINPFMGLKF